ncbi:unnamed protein product [Owenia fusiformis]|uniref:Uncharacterized protein n=1 Tax=Owenia fusiformis TaxID=6347 RepID=A0A8J1XM14_OWEFU|nr:unnamed protein product [Owenia fusiformis]
MDFLDDTPKKEGLAKFVLLFNKTTGTSKVQYIPVDSRTSRLIPKCEHLIFPKLKDLVGYRAVVMENYLYVIGGKTWDTGEMIDQTLRFDPMTNAWHYMAPMTTARAKFSVDVLDGCLFVTGGEVGKGKVTDSVECYNPLLDQWFLRKPMPKPRLGHASCSTQGKLLISGGYSSAKHLCTKDFWEYDPNLDTWVPLVNKGLPACRQKHVMVSTKRSKRNKIYILGGMTIDTEEGVELDDNTTWTFDYDLKDNTEIGPWNTMHPHIMHNRSNAGGVFLGKNIFLFGGRNRKGIPENAGQVEFFNTKKKKYYEAFQLDDPSLIDADCCVLKVPNTNTDFSRLGIVMYDKWILW